MNGITFRLLSVLVLLMSAGTSKAQKWIPFDEQEGDKTISAEIIKSDPTEYTVKVTMHGLSDELVTNGHGDFHRLSFGRDGYLSVTGEPSLPLFTQSIAIPTGATISAEITDGQWTDVEMGKIYPAQKPLLETEIARGFDYEEDVYNGNYMPTLLYIGNEMLWRNIRNTNVSVCPFKYYPQENRLSVMTQFVLKVSFAYDQRQDVNSFSKVEDPYSIFDNIPYTDASLIQDQNNSESARSANSDYYNYLIVVGDVPYVLNSDKLTEFCRWKAQKGFKTRVVSTNTFTTNPTILKDSILQEYNKGVRYVLFVGDCNKIPLGDVYTPSNRYVMSDYWYGCLVGDDLEAEIPIGRFSVESYADFCNMVDKTIKYEGKYNCYNRALLVAHAESSPNWFQGCCENIASLHNQQMTFKKAYGADYPDGNNATNANVIDSINNGAHIVNYRGHGSPVLWGKNYADEDEPPFYTWNNSGEAFTSSQINNMNNETCAVFFSIACKTGDIDDQTCMLETFTRSDHGAVAFIGATEDTYHYANDGYDKLLFNKLLNEHVYLFGDLNVSAHVANFLNVNYLNPIENLEDNPFCYICGGDPTLELWTAKPQKMSVTWGIVDDNFRTHTHLTGGEYVTVASMNGERIDSIAYTTSTCTIPIPSNYNQFYITVNKHDYLPYVIYYDSVSEEIINTKYDYDAYYSASPIDIFSLDSTDKVTVKNGHKLRIKKGSDGVRIWENFKCEKGAKFEIR